VFNLPRIHDSTTLVHLNIVVPLFDCNIDELIEIELDFEIICDLVPKSVEHCYDIIYTHGFVHGNDVAMNQFFDIDKNFENLNKGNHKANRHAKM
jgi:hypothetical protein